MRELILPTLYLFRTVLQGAALREYSSQARYKQTFFRQVYTVRIKGLIDMNTNTNIVGTNGNDELTGSDGNDTIQVWVAMMGFMAGMAMINPWRERR